MSNPDTPTRGKIVTAHHYTCIGSVRGSCGVKHRTEETAHRCCDRDARDCSHVGGYSDRHVVAFDTDGNVIDDHIECDRCGAEVTHGEELCTSCLFEVEELDAIGAEMDEYWD